MKSSTWSSRLIVLILLTIRRAEALIGYDCAKSLDFGLTFRETGLNEYERTTGAPTTRKVQVHLLELEEIVHVEVLECKVKTNRTIRDHVNLGYPIKELNEAIYKIGREECQRMHRQRLFEIAEGLSVMGLMENGTSRHSINLISPSRGNSTRYGMSVSEEDVHGESVYPIGKVSLEISMYKFEVDVLVRKNQIRLRSGVTCSFNEGSCFDHYHGFTGFWSPGSLENNCKFSQFRKLYSGAADHLLEINPWTNDFEREIYVITHGGYKLGLKMQAEHKACGYTAIQTEDPKLVILKLNMDQINVYPNVPVVFRAGGNFFDSVSSSYGFFERDEQQLSTEIFNTILKPKPASRSYVFGMGFEAFALFARTIIKEEGYMAVLTKFSGVAGYVYKCLPVEVRPREAETCYQELPVFRGEEKLFITAVTHLLVKIGHEDRCDRMMPHKWKIDGAWYDIKPKIIKSVRIPENVGSIKDVTRESTTGSATAELAGSADDKERWENLKIPMEDTEEEGGTQTCDPR